MRVFFDESTGYTLDQEVMIDGILEDFELKDANPVKVPISQEYEDLNLGESEVLPKDGKVSIKSFQSLVGSLLWICRRTRPDISFVVHKATRRTHAPKQVDWNLAKRIARYLKGSKHMKLHMGTSKNANTSTTIKAYSDSDYAGSKDDRKSTTGGVVLMNGMVLNWICKKQGGVSLSTMEAEFYATSKIEVEMLGFRELIQEVGLRVERPMVLLMDNQAAIKMISSMEGSSKMKHVDIRLKYIVSKLKDGEIDANYVPTQDMLADLLTKALPYPTQRVTL